MINTKYFIAVVATLTFCSQSAFAQGQVRNGLPPTNLDSFVYEAAGNADAIYGDEGTDGPPPDYMGFLGQNHIAKGFVATTTYMGLTTGHGSYMPSAWGADEFLNVPQEFYVSSPCTIVPQTTVNVTPGRIIIPSTVGGGNPTNPSNPGNVAGLNYAINADEGNLGGNFNSLEAQDQAIAQQERQDAAQNGGYITLQQQAQLNNEINNLSTQIQHDNSSGF